MPLHTEVPEFLFGKGVGSRLVRGMRDAAPAEGPKVVPRCEFVAACVARHPEYRHPPGDAGRGGASTWSGTALQDFAPVSLRACPMDRAGHAREHGAANRPGFLRRGVEAA